MHLVTSLQVTASSVSASLPALAWLPKYLQAVWSQPEQNLVAASSLRLPKPTVISPFDLRLLTGPIPNMC